MERGGGGWSRISILVGICEAPLRSVTNYTGRLHLTNRVNLYLIRSIYVFPVWQSPTVSPLFGGGAQFVESIAKKRCADEYLNSRGGER